jgi:hypothetical protein
MTDTKRKTLKLRQKDASGEIALNENPVVLHAPRAPHAPDGDSTLVHHNAEMVGEQRRRINYPHDEGS